MTKLEAAMAAMAFAHVVAMIDQGPHNTQDTNDLNLLKVKLRDDLATAAYLPALPPPGGVTTPPPGGNAPAPSGESSAPSPTSPFPYEATSSNAQSCEASTADSSSDCSASASGD